MTEAPPQSEAVGADTVYLEAVGLVARAAGRDLHLVFGLEDAALGVGATGTGVSRQILGTAAAAAGAIAEDAGGQARELEDVAAGRGQGLEFTAGDGAGDVGRVGIDERRHRSGDLHGFGDGADLELDVECVCLFAVDDDIVKLLGLEALFLHRQGVVTGGQTVDSVGAGAVGDGFAGRIGVVADQGDLGAGDDGPAGIGNDALQAGAVLRLGSDGHECQQKDHCRAEAEKVAECLAHIAFSSGRT